MRVTNERLERIARLRNWLEPTEARAIVLDLLEARLELATIERLLMPHTVGGSEYVGNPKRCAEAVVESLKRVMRFKQKAQEKHFAEAEKLRKDAERYKHIRTEAMIVPYGRRKADEWKVSWPFIEAPKQYIYPTYRERFDAALDAAIAAQRQKEGLNEAIQN